MIGVAHRFVGVLAHSAVGGNTLSKARTYEYGFGDVLLKASLKNARFVEQLSSISNDHQEIDVAEYLGGRLGPSVQ
ncbi:hypothetical protein THICB2_340006 [Thiomonas sp. CB2]|nr:hypothetical protein THICB2_340006 [Thiomonas sp. CB2]